MKKRLLLLVSSLFLLVVLAGCQTTPTDNAAEEEVIKDDDTKEEVEFVVESNDSFVITYGIENMDRGNHDFNNDHQVVIEKTNEVQRGDIIYFKYPEDDGLPKYNPDNYLARVVGLAGETVEIRDGQVYINNQKLETFYAESRRLGINKEEWFKASTTSPLKEADFEVNIESIKVPETAVFVLSDDWFRSASSIDFGPIEISQIKGKVFGYLNK
ncbi:signal peptidase I [Paenisporosarcina sp. TG20]|uniref:signal peptidase I n=1 Tax=Paenisporosarcina sp. TG20 TaxID=1211706 RepID=UPI0002FCE57E|nr:signal peptidase I [Paenisporosarcina sp. TG20]